MSCSGIAPGRSTDSGFLAPAYTLAPLAKVQELDVCLNLDLNR